MDCNKDEAVRAKEIAVRKFLEKDVIGATKFALKAQKLYPELEGISHLVANFELHMSAKFRRNGEIDWYRMLGVSPFADTETITKHYRKMALTIHPDKNREVGSESAFKLLSEAFRVLKDNTMRSAYDKRLNIQPVQKNVPSQSRFAPVAPFVPTQTGYPAPPHWTQSQQSVQTQTTRQSIPTQSGFPPVPPCGTKVGGSSSTRSGVSASAPRNNNASQQNAPAKGAPHNYDANSKHSTAAALHNNGTSGAKGHTKGGYPSSAINSSQERSSFWTRCTGCKMQFEYIKMFLDQIMCCPSCETIFLAKEIPTPSHLQNVDKCFSFHRRQNQMSSQKEGCGPSSMTIASDSKGFSPSDALKAEDFGEPSTKGKKRGCNETQRSAKLESKRQK